MAATRADGWGGDGTARALAWIDLGRKTGWTQGDEVKDSDRVRKGCRRIERETSESAYSWDSEGDGKMELAGIGYNVD